MYFLLALLPFVAARQHPGNGVEPPWVASPDGRGTLDIILSGGLTLILCVWTAVHCDIVPNSTEWGRMFYKGSWMVVALFAPEICVSCSFCQWREAKKLHRYWCNEFGIKPGSKEDLMGLEGALFVIMGGFVLEPNDDFPDASLTLTIAGFKRLIKSRILFDAHVNKKTIADKGKADMIAKTLVCAQASWMVVQIIGRKIDGLPVTLLEIHVIIQVFMTFLMYWFWWYKPLDVGEPILLSGVKIDTGELKSGQGMLTGRVQSVILTGGPRIISELLGLATQNDGAGILTAVMCLVYGGTHASAWNDHFPTPIERLMWRVSCMILAFGPWVQLTATGLTAHFPTFTRCLREHRAAGRGWRKCFMLWKACKDGYDPYVSVKFGLFGGTLFGGLCILYMFSIGYVTVEAFISIRSLPEGSYLTVNWEDYWPHLG